MWTRKLYEVTYGAKYYLSPSMVRRTVHADMFGHDSFISYARLIQFKNERKKNEYELIFAPHDEIEIGAPARGGKQADGYDAFIALEIHSADNALFFSFLFFLISFESFRWSLKFERCHLHTMAYMTYDMRHFQFLFPVGGPQKQEFRNFCRRQSVVCIIYFFYQRQMKRNRTNDRIRWKRKTKI